MASVEGHDPGEAAEQTLRDRQQQLTRELILNSVAERLENGDINEITMAEVARSAGVSARTVYRHFSSREDLIASTADWIAANRFGPTRMPQTVAELAANFRENLIAFDQHPGLVRTMAISRTGKLVRSARRRQRLEALHNALAEVTGNLTEDERRQAQALLGYLINMLAWVTMRDENGLTGEQIAQTMAWAINVLVTDLRERNEKAGEQ